MALSGVELFSKCLENPEPLVDHFYCSEGLVISEHAEETPTSLMKLWSEVRDRITAADVALSDGDDVQFHKQVGKLDELLANKGANFFEFTSFFPALDVSYSSFRSLSDRERSNFLSLALQEFLKKRHRIYQSHGYSPVTIQVRKDFEKHKSGGSSAKRKIEQICLENNYALAGSMDEFLQGRAFIHADSAAYATCEHWLREKDAQLPWVQRHQGKLPDVVVNSGSRILFVECKHMKEGGGGQDKQVSEIIDLIRDTEPLFESNTGYAFSYVAFMDGVYFNKFANPVQRKTKSQLSEINKLLESNPGNYFVNTWGWNYLILTS